MLFKIHSPRLLKTGYFWHFQENIFNNTSRYRLTVITFHNFITVSRDNINGKINSNHPTNDISRRGGINKVTQVREPQKENASLQPRRSVFFTHATIIRESSRGNSLFKLCIKRAKGTFDDFQRKRSTRRARTNQRGFPAICRDGEPVSSAYHRLEVEEASSRVAHAGWKRGTVWNFSLRHDGHDEGGIHG